MQTLAAEFSGCHRKIPLLLREKILNESKLFFNLNSSFQRAKFKKIELEMNLTTRVNRWQAIGTILSFLRLKYLNDCRH
jgi:hypothetical protein